MREPARCLMSTRMGIISKAIRTVLGMVSSIGTCIGKSERTGRTSVRNGIASSQLDGWFLVRKLVSLVVNSSDARAPIWLRLSEL